MGFMGRDIEMMKIDNEKCIIISCDSAGGIGDKDLDSVKTTPEILGALTARVALMEILAVGALPSMFSATICCEPEPTGQRILTGIYEELTSSGFDNLKTTISTEKNIITSQTGLGVTIVGICDCKELRIGRSQSGDEVYCLGLPRVGNEIAEGHTEELVEAGDIMRLNRLIGVKDIIPVGSGGILKEALLMANSIDKKLEINKVDGIDFNKSGGPSSCLIFSCDKSLVLPVFRGLPIKKIGYIY